MRNFFSWLTVSGAAGLILSGCSKVPQSATPVSEADKPKAGMAAGPAAKAGGGQEAAATTGNVAGVPGQASTASGDKPAAQTAVASKPDAALNAAGSNQPKQGAAEKKNVNVDQLSPSMNILTVSGEPVTVGEYRRMFKMQQVQLESLAVTNPVVRESFLNQAKKFNITLSPEEKQKLIAAARKAKAPDDAGFQKFLQDNKITAADFEKQICDIGIAVKTVNMGLQQSLLNDLINREILCQWGKQAGFSSKATNAFMTFKHTPQYKQVSDATGLSADDLKDEVVKNELSRLMMEKIQSRATIQDKELQDFYKKNKDKFQHKERIRMSQIIVAAPNIDTPTVQSVRSQIKKENAKLEGKELDDKVNQVMEMQRQKATAILTMAKSGQDFADLCNKLSDDMQVKKNKTGGDMGYQEKAQLIPEFAKAIWPLKSGQVYPGLVQTALGYHIVKVTEHQPAGSAALPEVATQLKALLLQQKQQQVVNNWLKEKRQTTKLVLAPQFASLLNNNANNQTSALTTTMPH